MSTTDDALLRITDVCGKTGLSASVIYELTREGAFPVPVQITTRATGWVASEVVDWIRSRPRVARFIQEPEQEGSPA